MEGSEDNATYDGLLLNILEREGKIDTFINIVFGFLLRNTDFFRIMPDPTAKFGFPPGAARGKIFEAFKTFEEKSFQLHPKEKHMVAEVIQAVKVNKTNKGIDARPMPTVILSPQTPQMPPQIATSRMTTNPSLAELAATFSNADALDTTGESRASTSWDMRRASTPPVAIREEVIPPSVSQNDADTYNGADRERYSWTQTIKDLDLRLKVDKSIQKGKQVRVQMEEGRIKVQVQKEGNFETLVDNALKWKIHPTNSLWTMVPGDHIHVNLEKIRERWWDACFVDEPGIELKAIDCSRPIEELDDESLATVNKLKFDQMQKEMGKPTSDQLKVMDQLKAGWDTEGSPFKGQPFDPSVLNFGGS